MKEEKKLTSTSDVDKMKESDELIPEENLEQMMEELKEELKEDPEPQQDGSLEDLSSDTMETVTKEIETKPETLVKYRIFFVSDMDEEARYLHEMSMSGYHFKEKKGIRYIFELGEVKNYYYHLGYYEHGLRDGDRYVENFKEAGWESIYHEKSEFDGMLHYFRTLEEPGAPEPEIYSDRKSRNALYKRLLSSWRNLITMIVILMVFMLGILFFLLTHPTIYQGIFMTIFTIVAVLLIGTFILYLTIYMKVKKKLLEFKYQS